MWSIAKSDDVTIPLWAIAESVPPDSGKSYILEFSDRVVLAKRGTVEDLIQVAFGKIPLKLKGVFLNPKREIAVYSVLIPRSSADFEFNTKIANGHQRIRALLGGETSKYEYGTIVTCDLVKVVGQSYTCSLENYKDQIISCQPSSSSCPTISLLWEQEKTNLSSCVIEEFLDLSQTKLCQKLNIIKKITDKQNEMWCEERIEDALAAKKQGNKDLFDQCIKAAQDLNPQSIHAKNIKWK